MRDMLFVSHANPEDNEFTRWLALQLANEGYGVWCDLTKLLGGERFWNNIEDAIRNRTAKFLFVLSKSSNDVLRDSPKDELELALAVRRKEKLEDFIVPLWVDDLKPADFYVRLQSITATRFQEGWRNGLDALLKKLEKDSVPKRPDFGPEAVRSWWRTFRDPRFAVRGTPETLLTNWYPVTPSHYYFHTLERTDQTYPGPISVREPLPHPGVPYNQYLVTFAPAADLNPHLRSVRIQDTKEVKLDSLANGDRDLWSGKDRSSALTQLLNQAWQQMISRKGLATFTFSGGQPSFYFLKGTAPEDKVEYIDGEGKKHWRNIVGVSTQGKNLDGTPKVRYWHFGLEAKAVMKPRLGFLIKSHVLFSDDGTTIWTNDLRLHKARRSQCKAWWNDKWRDLILGTMSWLADGAEFIQLPVGEQTTLAVSLRPLQLTTTVSYDEAELDRYLKPEEEADVDELDPAVLDEDDDGEQDVADDTEGEEDGQG
jgi:hypothetical protein